MSSRTVTCSGQIPALPGEYAFSVAICALSEDIVNSICPVSSVVASEQEPVSPQEIETVGGASNAIGAFSAGRGLPLSQ